LLAGDIAHNHTSQRSNSEGPATVSSWVFEIKGVKYTDTQVYMLA
jgi:hypothetical protein